MRPDKPLAFSYVRFSTPEQAKGDSERRQTEKAEQYAATHGLELSDMSLKDLGRSAYRGKNLQEGALSAFRLAVELGDIPRSSYLLLESPDRLSRLPAIDATEALNAICKLGVTVVTLDDGQEYDHERLRKEFFIVLKWLMRAEVGHDESRKKADRVASAWAEKRRKAKEKKLTALCPGWLEMRKDRSGFERVPDKVAVVRRIFNEALDGSGQEAIARRLNEDGIPTFGQGRNWKDGRQTRWHKSMITKIVRNPEVTGVYQPHKMVEGEDGRQRRMPDGPPIKGYYPSIIPAEKFATLQARLVDKRAPYAREKFGQTITNPLAGIAKCGLCGSSMTQVVKGRRSKPVLVCSKAKVGAGCEYHSIRVSDVWAALSDPLLTAEAPIGSDETRRQWERLEAERLGAHEHVANLAKAIAGGGPSAALRSHLAEAERDLADLEARSRALASQVMAETPNSVKRRLEALQAALEAPETTAAELNARLRENLRAAVIQPASPDEGTAASITFQWLHGGETSAPLGGFG